MPLAPRRAGRWETRTHGHPPIICTLFWYTSYFNKKVLKSATWKKMLFYGLWSDRFGKIWSKCFFFTTGLSRVLPMLTWIIRLQTRDTSAVVSQHPVLLQLSLHMRTKPLGIEVNADSDSAFRSRAHRGCGCYSWWTTTLWIAGGWERLLSRNFSQDWTLAIMLGEYSFRPSSAIASHLIWWEGNQHKIPKSKISMVCNPGHSKLGKCKMQEY